MKNTTDALNKLETLKSNPLVKMNGPALRRFNETVLWEAKMKDLLEIGNQAVPERLKVQQEILEELEQIRLALLEQQEKDQATERRLAMAQEASV